MRWDKSTEAIISQKIKELMEKAGIKPFPLAKKIGLESSNFYRQLTGKRRWQPKHLAKLADFFDITVESIIGGPLEDMKNTKHTPLPVRIPSDLAAELGVHPSFISHWNAGRKPVPKEAIIQLMEIARHDSRLDGLTIFHLKPEIQQLLPYICNGCPRLIREPKPETMKFRAMIKLKGNSWIGWLIDLPGVNAQEKTREELLESLRIGAENMLSTAVPFEAEAQMTTIEIPAPEWSLEDRG
jgi:predicted RNase H-like HicB family nuclease/plasmid maintenance system antidote protein VapI